MELIGLLAHPKGYGFAPSEIDQMTIDDLIFWGEQLSKINKKLYSDRKK